MPKKFFIYIAILTIVTFFAKNAYAAEDPLSVPNNKFGIHILFPEELDKAASLINSTGGDWGYITIPIQANDRNLIKWQAFMDKAKTLHMIPIIRLATSPYYFNTSLWQKPAYGDVLDFANFLNSLNWPTKNRYVVIFNEPNRNAEWGGSANPSEYARILDYSTDYFKNLNQDFFIISAGFDNAADTNSESINEYEFIRKMNYAIPGIFREIDGFASHSYPNPGFSQPPWINTSKSITSFLYESQLVSLLSNKNLPIFITETGWTKNLLSDSIIANYYKNAFSTVWSNEKIVAVTPFLLQAYTAPFAQFSFLGDNQKPNKEYQALENIQKIEGKPILADIDNRVYGNNKKILSVVSFNLTNEESVNIFSKTNTVKTLLKWLLNI